MDRSISSGDV